MGKMMSSVVAGALMGAAVGMVIIPQLDRKTQKALKRTSNKIMGMAEDTYDNMMWRMR